MFSLGRVSVRENGRFVERDGGVYLNSLNRALKIAKTGNCVMYILPSCKTILNDNHSVLWGACKVKRVWKSQVTFALTKLHSSF